MYSKLVLAVVLVALAHANSETLRTQRSPIPVPLVDLPTTVKNSTRARDSICKERYARYSVAEYCDSFIECRNYVASEMVCPDGLHFNPDSNIHEYPCVYPIDSPCQGQGKLHPAEPTEACPHQYGFFASGSAQNCGEFRSCVAGNGINFRCPQGLAFNPLTYDCDWPENVADCDVASFLGFKCPAVPVDADGNAFEGIIPFPYPNSCRKFYACIQGHPRILRCDEGLAFNSENSQCELAELVRGCENSSN